METVTDRVTRYFLRRIRRLMVIDVYDQAVEAGLLDVAFINGNEADGTVWQCSKFGSELMRGDADRGRSEIARLLKQTPTIGLSIGKESEKYEDVRSMPRRLVEKQRKLSISRNALPEVEADGGSVPSSAIFSGLRRHLPPMKVAHVAVALLLARAAGQAFADMPTLLAALGRRDLIILVKVPVLRFERQLGRMLEDGLVMPYWATLIDLHGATSISDRYKPTRPGKTRRKIITASGVQSTVDDTLDLRRRISNVLLRDPLPILIADETNAQLLPQLVAAADVVIGCSGFDHEMLAELLHLCSGIPPKRSLRAMAKLNFDAGGLSLDDLALAVRPGRSLDAMLTAMTVLKSPAGQTDEGGEGRDAGRGKSTSSKLSGGKSSAAPKIEIVHPVGDRPNGDLSTSSAQSPRRDADFLETLTGYGKAAAWALDLRNDMAQWKKGEIGWSDMSTKLLLSGPPGTGKTTFARALCNTLQVPLIISSVAAWLEPGYLGDVLKQISMTFEAATNQAPAILFIDEIDNIGSRNGSGARQNDDYWVSLINRLLELLDGSVKTEGVIVVAATNLPDKIDPALLRSGRLETHVKIPLPDVDALAGIFAHHLGGDLAGILKTAPPDLPQEAPTRQAQISNQALLNLRRPPTIPKETIHDQREHREFAEASAVGGTGHWSQRGRHRKART